MAAVDESSASVVGDHDIFIGRHLCPSSSAWLPGSIEVPRRSANFGLMRVFDAKGNMSEQGNGDILVEIEPIRYELEIHASMPDDEPRRTRKVVKADTELAKSSLFRFDEGKDIEARMQKVLSYEYEKSEYYGQVGKTFLGGFVGVQCTFWYFSTTFLRAKRLLRFINNSLLDGIFALRKGL